MGAFRFDFLSLSNSSNKIRLPTPKGTEMYQKGLVKFGTGMSSGPFVACHRSAPMLKKKPVSTELTANTMRAYDRLFGENSTMNEGVLE